MALLGSADFLGINYYCGSIVSPHDSDTADISYWADRDIDSRLDPRLYRSASPWLRVDPGSVRKVMSWIKRKYDNPVIYVTENGFSDALGNLDDAPRVYFHKHYINELLKGKGTRICAGRISPRNNFMFS